MVKTLSILLALAGLTGCKQKPAAPLPPPRETASAAQHVGTTSCASCHETEYRDWMGSHHQLAMQEATETSVLGDFNNAVFVDQGVTNRFFKRNGGFWAEVEGPDGSMQEYPVRYAFGYYPLQQYVVPLEAGRLQVLTVCWDCRPREEGGQRWYTLYENEGRIHHYDELHWTSGNFNWNYMCVECHTTEYKKNFDPVTLKYNSTFKEINVACEACHGPGSTHVAWAKQPGLIAVDEFKGLVPLREKKAATWTIDSETGRPHRSTPIASDIMLETCAPCHARREKLTEPLMPGVSLTDQILPTVLDTVNYHHDGQIKEEDYVFSSFVQSKMYRAGVRCVDCHNPHSLKLKLPGNALCAQCHLPNRYDTPAHHFHETGSRGAMCVECHMPETTYMGVDPRRDHSFQTPRPDLSLSTGVPNACIRCHSDQDNAWALERTTEWYGPTSNAPPHFAEYFSRAAQGDPTVVDDIRGVFIDRNQADIVRATALWHLQFLPGNHADIVDAGTEDPNPMVRQMAVRLGHRLSPPDRVRELTPALKDPRKAVRLEAVSQLADVHPDVLGYAHRKTFDEMALEYLDAQRVVEDRASGDMRRGIFYTAQGDSVKAEAAYRQALRAEVRSMPPRINLAELLFSQGKPDEALALLKEGVALRPNSAFIHDALGHHLVRQKKYPEGLKHIRQSLEINPNNARLQYFYGVGMQQLGQLDESLNALKQAAEQAPYDEEILTGCTAIALDQGNKESALHFVGQLRKAFPDNARYTQWETQIRVQP